jgi:hypothetical protein
MRNKKDKSGAVNPSAKSSAVVPSSSFRFF